VHKKKKPTKCPKFKCNTVSISFSACRCSSVVFSSKVGRQKKKSLETGLWMAICGCGLPACCCQPAVAGCVIYADLWGELSTHLALQALFIQSSPVHKPLLQAYVWVLNSFFIFIFLSVHLWAKMMLENY
jgi:hypothetical protein